MKLRINAKLRAAIIAAIATVGFTLPQAQAAEATVLTTGFSLTGTASNQWSLTSTSGEGYDLTASNASLIKLKDSSNLANKNSGNEWASQLSPNTNVQTDSGWKLTFTVTNNGTEAVTIDSMTINSFLFSGAGAYQSAQTTRSFVLTMGPDGGTTENDVTITGSSNNNPETGVIKWDFSNAVTLAANGGQQAFTVQFVNGTGTYASLGCFVGLTSIELTRNVVSGTSTWKGTEDAHAWSNADAWDNAFQTGNVAVFGSEATYQNVDVDQAVNADEIQVTGGEYTLASQGADKTIATTKLTVASGASVTFTGAGATTISTLTGAGDLIAGAGSNVTLTSLSDFTGTYGVTGGGALTVGFSINQDLLSIADGTLNLGSNRHTINTLTIGDDGLVIAVGADNSNGCVSGDIDIKAGGTFRMTGHHDAFGWGGNATKNIILTGESDTKRAELQFQQTTGNSATFKTNLKMMGHALVSTTKNGFNTYGGSIYAEGVDNTIEKFQLRSAATIEVAENGELTVGEMVYGADSTHNLTKTGAGTLTFTGTANMQALDLQDGSLVINGGTTTVAGDSTSTLNKTITVSAGSLVLRGTYEIGGNTGEMTTTYVGGEAEGVNGFEHVAGSSTVYTKGDGATVNVEGATFTVGGEEVELENGVYTTEGSTNFGTFFVKSGAESLDKALTYAGEHTVSTVSLAEGTTINADHAGATIGLAMQGSATVNATEATTISSISGWSGNTLTVAGTATVSTPGALFLDEAGDALTVEEGVTLAITGSNNLTVLHGEATINGTLTIGHEIDLSKGSSSDGKITIGSTGSVTAKDGMWMNHTAVGVLLEEGGTLTITGKGVKFTGKEDGSIKVAAGKEMNYTVGNTDAIITNATMEALGNITIANQLVNVDLVTGEFTVTLNKTIAVGTGTLGLDGTFAIGGIAGTEVASYAGGDVQDNGFKTSTTTRAVYTKEEGGVVIVAQGSVFKVGDNEVELRADGTAVFDNGTDYTKFYVNSESEAVSTALDGHQPTAFQLATSTTLQVDENIAATVTGAGATSVVTIDSDKVLTGTAQNVALTGAGTYALNANAQALGTGVTLGEGWEGTVRLSGSINNIKFDASVLGNHVEVCGLSGYFYDLTVGGRGNYAGTLTLTNPEAGTPALLINNGYSRDNAYYELSGAVDGSGTWRFDKGDATVTNRIIFSGNTADWVGAIELTKGYALELTFAQTNGEMGAAITRNGGTLNMIVGNADGQSTMFNQEVTASALTINEGATATFEADATFGSLSGAGSLVVDEGATLKITGDVSADVAIVAKNGAVIDSANVDPVHIGIDKESTATFEQGIAQENGISFSEGVQVTNNGGEEASYDTSKQTMAVTAEWLSFDGAEDVSVANIVNVDAIVNMSGHKLTLENAASLELSSVTLVGEGSVLALNYKDEQQAVQEGTVTITESLTAGGGTLLANLTLKGGSTLDLSLMEGGMQTLTLGSTLTVDTATGLILLDDDTIAALEGLALGHNLDLFKALEGTGLEYGSPDGYDGTWFDAMFVRTENVHGDYRVYANETSFGLTKVNNMPEPTTGTLSLLALMALAARRRKH